MAIYLINFLTIPIYDLVFKDKKKCLSLILIQMWLIMIFRSQTLGDDVLNYARYYEVWSRYSFKEIILSTRFILNQNIAWGLESGYVWLCWLCAKMGMSFHSFLVIHSTICIMGIGSFLKKYSEDAILSLLIIISFGVWGTFFYILRQSLAFVILLWSYQCAIEKKPFKFVALCCVAVMFHRAAIIFLLIYFLSKIKITGKIVFAFSIISAVFALLFSKFYKFIYFFLRFANKEDMYKMGEVQTNKMLVCFVLLFVMVLLLSKNLQLLNDDKNTVLTWCFMLTIFVEIISLYVPDFSRIAICELFPFCAVLISNIINEQKIQSNRLLMRAISFIILFIFYIYVIKDAAYVPYRSMWG